MNKKNERNYTTIQIACYRVPKRRHKRSAREERKKKKPLQSEISIIVNDMAILN